jgi:broad specificity phosphatase PhoE
MKIYLIRHGQSRGNVDKKVHAELPDHAIGLSEEGKEQAKRAGEFLGKRFLIPSGIDNRHIRMWISPYKRTRETASNFENGFMETAPYYFKPYLEQREHINLVEQQFGLFDGIDDEDLPKLFPNEHAHYDKAEKFEGRFWARMPLGESRFDVAVRVHQFFGTIMRDADKHGISNLFIVSHGVTIRAFIMQWLHLPFEWFEKEPNPKNCSIRLIDDKSDCGYIYKGE